MRSLILALAVLAAPAAGAGVKWVPLNSARPSPAKPTVAPMPVAPSPMQAVPAAEVQATRVPPPVPVQAAPVESPSTSNMTPGRLDLTCFGGGTANKAASATAWTHGSASGSVGWQSWSGSGSSTTTVVGTRQQGFGDQVDVRLFAGDDRIRMPRTMLPLIRGGREGWFKLRDVRADARSIRASAAVNVLNNPKVFIDRVTGTISISGKAGDYVGQCEVIDASAPAKF